MARLRSGNQSVLLIVDAQVGVIGEAWEVPRVVQNIARAVARARDRGVPVLWVQHEDGELQRDSAAWQFVPELAPAAGEGRIHKRFESAFEETTLEAGLARATAEAVDFGGADFRLMPNEG